MDALIMTQNTDARALMVENVSDLSDRWIRFVDATPKTTETYNRAIRQFWKYLDARGIKNPIDEDVISFRENLKREGCKPATVQNYITAIRLFFRWTAKTGIYTNIAEGIKGAKIDKEHKKDPLTEDQAGEVLDKIDTSTARGKRDYAILFLMMTTGLRVISVVNADIGDIHATAGGHILFYRGKGHAEKAVFVKLSMPVYRAIREYLDSRSDAENPKSPLFTSTANRNTGARLTVRAISGIVKNHLRAAGFDSDRLTAHSLRHTAATIGLLNGATLEETRQLLDHVNINTTMIYNHAIERARNQIESKITKAIQKQRKRAEVVAAV